MYPMTQAVLDRVLIYSPGRLRSFFFFRVRNVCAFNFCHVAKWPSYRKNFLRVLIFAAQATDEIFLMGKFPNLRYLNPAGQLLCM